ncbi:MAG TPA: hypothetical protein DGB85_05070 [Deltaproteobacteria bacterium]|nr:hypothetical protein [Deltaproteobacteria bacterium]
MPLLQLLFASFPKESTINRYPVESSTLNIVNFWIVLHLQEVQFLLAGESNPICFEEQRS